MTEEAGRLEETVAGLQGAERNAASRYRDLALEREPDLPADLVAGETIAEVDAALEQARQTVARVRQHLDDQARAARVPAGAPPRGEPDASGLSSAEKIRLGLSRE